MTLLPPIPSASLPSGLDSMRKIAGGIEGTSADGMPREYRALVGAAQVCAGILLTLMGISAGKVQSEYGTRTPAFVGEPPRVGVWEVRRRPLRTAVHVVVGGLRGGG